MGLYKAKPRLVDLYTLDSAVLSTLSIPDDLDAGVCRAMILQECGELETVFETAAELKAYLTPWSEAHAEPWERMLSALAAEYNPIHNYDRADTETITDSENGSSKSSGTQTTSASETASGTNTTSVAKADTTTVSRQGFDSADFVPADETAVAATESGASTAATNGSSSGSRTESVTLDSERAAARARVLHSSGNIGVTTAQQMITAELDMRTKHAIYNIIVDAFRCDICVGVW